MLESLLTPMLDQPFPAVELEPNVDPTAAFSSSVAKLVVTFTDESTDGDGSIVAWSWDFGDSTTSTNQNPVHTYATAGVKTVQLTVTDNRGGTDTVSHNVTAVANVAPTAGFTHSESLLVSTFTDTSSDSDGTIASWAWDFGDSSTSTSQNPSHTYATGGTYTVQLTVTDNNGATNSTSQSVTVSSGARGNPSVAILLDASSTVGGTTQVTGLATPTANKLQIFAVASAASAAVNTPTVTGQGLTWVQIQTVAYVASNRKLTVFRAMGSSPSLGVLTVDFGGQTQTSVAWVQLEITGTDTTGTNGSGAIVQSTTKTVGAGVSTISATALSAFEHANNLNLTVTANDINGTMTPDADFTEITDRAITAGNITLHTQRAVNQTTCDTTFSGSTSAGGGGVSMEIKAS